MKKTFIAFTLAVAITACNNSGNKTNSENKTDEGSVELTSKPEDLMGKEWKLEELNGVKIKLDTTFKNYPYIKFDAQEKISGNLGCNGFGANAKFNGADSIKVSDIVGTQMACPNLKIEQDFSEALRNAKTYKVDGNVLYLNNEHSVVAKLETIANP